MKKCLAHRSAETWSAATRRCLAQKAATSRRTPQTYPIGLNDDQGPLEVYGPKPSALIAKKRKN